MFFQIFVGVALCGLVGILGLAGFYFYMTRGLRRSCNRPIVCVCKENRRVGVVLRKDYDQASREHWKPYRKGELDFRHRGAELGNWGWLHVSPTFVFDEGSPQLVRLLQACYVEKAAFWVPKPGFPADQSFFDAYRHIYGKPWDGQPPDKGGDPKDWRVRGSIRQFKDRVAAETDHLINRGEGQTWWDHTVFAGLSPKHAEFWRRLNTLGTDRSTGDDTAFLTENEWEELDRELQELKKAIPRRLQQIDEHAC